jgi:hypothetical protein
VPGAILARLDAGQTAWLSELRHVSVLLLRLPDLDDITPGTLRKATDVVREVQEALYEYEGSVNKLGVDDKGTTLVAAFGLPPVAHEDDPVRAVRAALGIQAQLRRHRVPFAIGIATGRAFCGSVGSELRREYTMIGRVVNRGARLMQTALDDVVCDRATQQAANAKLTFERLPPRQVKGVAEPVVVFRPRGLRPTRGAPGRSLVGRALAVGRKPPARSSRHPVQAITAPPVPSSGMTIWPRSLMPPAKVAGAPRTANLVTRPCRSLTSERTVPWASR